MVMDVNGLKMANDAFGHKMGDNLLITSANILKSVTRADDILCRAGGDEFMLILPNTGHDETVAIKKRISEKAKKPYWILLLFQWQLVTKLKQILIRTLMIFKDKLMQICTGINLKMAEKCVRKL
jgi:GGDEF domain-containing protein